MALGLVRHATFKQPHGFFELPITRVLQSVHAGGFTVDLLPALRRLKALRRVHLSALPTPRQEPLDLAALAAVLPELETLSVQMRVQRPIHRKLRSLDLGAGWEPAALAELLEGALLPEVDTLRVAVINGNAIEALGARFAEKLPALKRLRLDAHALPEAAFFERLGVDFLRRLAVLDLTPEWSHIRVEVEAMCRRHGLRLKVVAPPPFPGWDGPDDPANP